MAVVKAIQRDPKLQLSDGAVAFSPGNIPGLIVWLDPSNSGSVSVISNALQQINDLSGHGNHFQAPSSGQRPPFTTQINLLNVMTLGSTGPYQLNCVNSVAYGPSLTVITIEKAVAVAATAGTVAMDDGGSNRLLQHRWNTSTQCESVTFPGGSANTLDSSAVANITLAAHAHAAILDNSAHTSTILYDNTQVGQNTGLAAFNTTTMVAQIGRAITNGTNWWNGQLGEVLIYNAALTSVQLANVKAYLSAKWGTP